MDETTDGPHVIYAKQQTWYMVVYYILIGHCGRVIKVLLLLLLCCCIINNVNNTTYYYHKVFLLASFLMRICVRVDEMLPPSRHQSFCYLS